MVVSLADTIRGSFDKRTQNLRFWASSGCVGVASLNVDTFLLTSHPSGLKSNKDRNLPNYETRDKFTRG